MKDYIEKVRLTEAKKEETKEEEKPELQWKSLMKFGKIW
jgi:hypothetical protein